MRVVVSQLLHHSFVLLGPASFHFGCNNTTTIHVIVILLDASSVVFVVHSKMVGRQLGLGA